MSRCVAGEFAGKRLQYTEETLFTGEKIIDLMNGKNAYPEFELELKELLMYSKNNSVNYTICNGK